MAYKIILPRKDAFTGEAPTFNTRREADATRRRGDRIYYDSKNKKYYIKKINSPFWGR